MRLARAALAVGLLPSVLLASCATESPEAPAEATVLEVTMREYAFEHSPSTKAARVIFRVQNRGSLHHQLVLVAFPEGFKRRLDEQLRSPDRRVFRPLAFVPTRPPGRSGTFAVDLTPGRYGLACFVQEPGDTESHALKGMTSEFSVR